MVMIIWLCLRWWYSAGWRWVWQRLMVDRANWVMETFSVTDLSRTLFAPFRQTFAGRARGPLAERFRAFLDRSISRVIGFFVRIILLFMAAVMFVVVLLTSIVGIVAWPFIPLLPIIGVLAWLGGVGA
jgi:hypothetical protein